MSKSLGNVFGLHETVERWGAETLLMYFCGAHWRQPMEFDDDRLSEARARAAGIRETARHLVEGSSPAWSAPLRERFFDALAHDFNTPRALAIVAEWTREVNRLPAGTVGSADLGEMLEVLGLRGLLHAQRAEIPERAAQLSTAREQARRERDYAAADRLRDELRELGWEVRDGPDGPELLPAA
jgi:cysteinyl-tRNA synthetase